MRGRENRPEPSTAGSGTTGGEWCSRRPTRSTAALLQRRPRRADLPGERRRRIARLRTGSGLPGDPEGGGVRATCLAPCAGHPGMQLHLDFEVSDLAAATEHAIELGARLAEYQPQDVVRVLLDPPGIRSVCTAHRGSAVSQVRGDVSSARRNPRDEREVCAVSAGGAPTSTQESTMFARRTPLPCSPSLSPPPARLVRRHGNRRRGHSRQHELRQRRRFRGDHGRADDVSSTRPGRATTPATGGALCMVGGWCGTATRRSATHPAPATAGCGSATTWDETQTASVRSR